MNSSRNKFLIQLSNNNVEHHNVSSFSTMASELSKAMTEKENDGRCTDYPSANQPYDKYSVLNFDSRNVSPLIHLNEIELTACIPDSCSLGEGISFTELLPVFSTISDNNKEVLSTLNSPQKRASPMVTNENNKIACHASQNILEVPQFQGMPPNNTQLTTHITHSCLREDLSITELLPASTNFDHNEDMYKPLPAKPNTPQKRTYPESHGETGKTSPDLTQNLSIVKMQAPPAKKLKRTRNPQLNQEIQRQKHPIRPPCVNCRKMCTVNITDEERKSIYNQFWNLERQRRRDFLSRQVQKKNYIGQDSWVEHKKAHFDLDSQ